MPFKTRAPKTVSLWWHGDGRQGCVCGIWAWVFHSRELTLEELVMLRAADVILQRWRPAIAAAESMPHPVATVRLLGIPTAKQRVVNGGDTVAT